tara:strand:- start:820 stop:1206 length:387 start_codon:yes stop_codon:yes gene_type:complete
MPSIKTSIYDGAVSLSGVSEIDLSGATAKFEIVAVTILGTATGAAGCALELEPSTTNWCGTVAPGNGTWAATAEESFGAESGSVGTVFPTTLAIVPGVTLEGRWQRVKNKTASSLVICYLKAKTARTV